MDSSAVVQPGVSANVTLSSLRCASQSGVGPYTVDAASSIVAIPGFTGAAPARPKIDLPFALAAAHCLITASSVDDAVIVTPFCLASSSLKIMPSPGGPGAPPTTTPSYIKGVAPPPGGGPS